MLQFHTLHVEQATETFIFLSNLFKEIIWQFFGTWHNGNWIEIRSSTALFLNKVVNDFLEICFLDCDLKDTFLTNCAKKSTKLVQFYYKIGLPKLPPFVKVMENLKHQICFSRDYDFVLTNFFLKGGRVHVKNCLRLESSSSSSVMSLLNGHQISLEVNESS